MTDGRHCESCTGWMALRPNSSGRLAVGVRSPVTTTQIYDKRRRTTKESASHDVPI
jgi:hypothetical protein